jgi:hypothetical protein
VVCAVKKSELIRTGRSRRRWRLEMPGRVPCKNLFTFGTLILHEKLQLLG